MSVVLPSSNIGKREEIYKKTLLQQQSSFENSCCLVMFFNQRSKSIQNSFSSINNGASTSISVDEED